MIGKLFEAGIESELKAMRESMSPELYAMLEPTLIRSLTTPPAPKQVAAPSVSRALVKTAKVEAKEPPYRSELEDFVQGVKRTAPPGRLVRGIRGVGPISPTAIAGLEAWFRFGTGITVTGAGVSTWADQSENGRDLLQGTDANRPALQADGSILFDGVDNYLKTAAFTFNQPETIYILGKQITWTNTDTIFDGEAAGSGRLLQVGVSPQLTVNAGAAFTETTGQWVLNTYAALCVVINGASSLLRVNNIVSVSGDAGAANLGGFNLGADSNPASYSNIQVKEVILYSGAHDAATQDKLILYLRSIPSAK